MSSKTMDRRSFMGRIAITAGGGVAASVLPASLLQAGESSARVMTAACVATPRHPDSCGDWTLDDMCNAYPGYAYDVSPATPQPLQAADVADIDRMWVA